MQQLSNLWEITSYGIIDPYLFFRLESEMVVTDKTNYGLISNECPGN